MFYYPISFLSVLGFIPSLIFGLLLCAIIITALQQKFFWGKRPFPMTKILLLNCFSLALFIGTLYLLGVSRALEGIGSLVMIFLDSLFGSHWEDFKMIASLLIVLGIVVLINFLVFGLFFWLWLYQKTTKTHQMPSFITSKNVLMAAISFLGTPMLAFILMFVTILTVERCNSLISDVVIRINAHVKSLCFESPEKGECPQNYAQLIAFDPRSFQRLSWCAKSEYSYNVATQTGTWVVYHPNQQVFVSHPQFYPGFGYFPLKELPNKLPELTNQK